MSKRLVFTSSFVSFILILALSTVWNFSTPSQKVVTDDVVDDFSFSNQVIEQSDDKHSELIASLQQELLRVKEEIVDLRQQDRLIEMPQSGNANTSDAAENMEVNTPGQTGYTSAETSPYLDQEYFENQHAYENVDPSWSAYAQDSIQNVFYDKEFQDVSLVNSDCRSTTCKLEFEHMDSDSLDAFYQEFGAALGWDHDAVISLDNESGDTVKTTVYLQKIESSYEGYALDSEPEIKDI